MTDSKDFFDEQDNPALKPFRLVKFFSFTALVFFLVSTIVLVWLISNHTKKMLLERSEAYAMVSAENLNHQVYQQFVIPTLLRYGNIALRNQEQFRRLDVIVRNTTHGLNMQSVTIFDREEGIVSYSTVADMVGKKGLGPEEYRKALQGENNSVLIFDGSLLNLLPGGQEIFCQLKTYIPFRQEEGLSQPTGQIMGVFEIVQDLSDDFTALIKLQGVIIGTSVFIMSALFVVLWLIVAKGDDIIERRSRERRRLEEKLNHAQRLAGLGKMVASVSHEIKNPLGIVRSTAEILGKRLKAVAPGNDHLANIIVEETSRLDGIVREFLDFARPQKLRVSTMAVNEILDKAVQFMGPEFNKANVTLKNEIVETAAVPVDAAHLYQAFLNILVNAVQAMPDGGILTARAGNMPPPAKGVRVEIRDSGCGMSAEVQQQIFTPFYTNKNRGTGLGLAIVKNIIDGHHGRILAESREGDGTTFIIELSANPRGSK